MKLSLLFRLVGRELRGARARLVPFLASLAVGVAAIVLVAGLADSVSRALRMEARPILGGDVSVRSSRPIPDLSKVLADFPEVERADTVDFLTMAAAPATGRSVMVELKAVAPQWPFYGTPTFSRQAPATLDATSAVVEPALLDRLGTPDTIRVGDTAFSVAGTVTAEPGRLPSGLAPGPRVFVSLDGLARAGLGPGARTTYRAIFKVPDETRAASFAKRLQAEAGPYASVETWSDAQPATQRSIERTASYLGLVALLSLVVGGVGVAQGTRAWMARRLDALAVQRCLGLTSGELRTLAFAQTTLLALSGSTLGAVIGVGALALVPFVLAGVLPPEAVQPWQPAAVAKGIALGVGVALLFAARPLDRASRVPPLRVLRRDVEPLPDPFFRAGLGYLALGAGIFGLARVQSADPVIAAIFTGGLALVAGAGVVTATVIARLLGRLAHSARPWWLRHGLASAGRPGAGLVPAVVALAVGVVVVLTTVLVEGRLFAQVAEEFPEQAPSVFLVDVQPDQSAGITHLLTEKGATLVRAAPMVVARIAEIDGKGIDALVAERGEDARWSLTREQRLTYMAELPADNRIVAGAPFSDAVPNELSLEQRYAESLGATVGSHLRFDVQGVPVDLVVANIRTVSWESFNMNFFLVAEPGVLEAAPQSVLVTAQLPADREAGVQDEITTRWPNVALLSVRSILTQVRGLLTRLGWGIRAVGGFTALAGVTILVSGVAADAARQGRKVALLKTLGTTRAGVVGLFAVEYGILGLLAGALGAAGAVGFSYAVVTRMMHLAWRTDGYAVLGSIVITGVLAAMVGVLANTRALRVRPAEVLRGE